MYKTFLVARHEFIRYATRRGFLFVVFGMPLLLLGVILVTILLVTSGADDPIGIVDKSGRLVDPGLYNESHQERTPLRAYPDEARARPALEEGEIQAFLAVPADYPANPHVTLYHSGETFEGIQGEIITYLRTSLLRSAGAPADVTALLAAGPPELQFHSLREEAAQDPISAFIFPFVIGFLLVMSIFTTSGYLLQTVVDEKENRTMEILLTSLRPEQLITGKIVGLVALGLLQTAVWTGALIVAFLLARTRYDVFQQVSFSNSLVFIALAWFLPFYLMMASFMAAIGISVTQVSEGQQASSILSLLAVAPFWLLVVLIESPDGPLSIALTLIPFTAPLSLLVRWPLTEVPAWQLILSWLLLAGAAALALFLVSRLLRVGLLRYGQPLTLREVARVLRLQPSHTPPSTTEQRKLP